MEDLPELLATTIRGARVSGMLAFVICLICHQVLLFSIGRWTVELDGWRALLTTMAGVAGLSIGSVTLPPLAAPLLAMTAAFITMRYVYEMDAWQQGVMAAGWYAFPLGALFLAGVLFSSAETPSPQPVGKERLMESLKKSGEKQPAAAGGETKPPEEP